MEDANELIDIAREMGFFDVLIKEYLPNATKCLTQADVQRSHFGEDEKVVFKLDNIYGMIIMLCIGLGLATLIAMLELTVYKAGIRKEDPNRVIVI